MHFPDLRPHILLAKTISHVAHTRHIQTPQQLFVSSPHFALVASRLSQSASVLASTMATPISIIVAGASTPQGAEFLKHAKEESTAEGEVDGRSRRAKRPNDQMEKPTAAESTEKPKEKPKEKSKVEKPKEKPKVEKPKEKSKVEKKRTEKRRIPRHPAYMPRKTWYDKTRQSLHTANGEIVWVFNGEGMGAKENLNPPRYHVVAGCSRLSHAVASAIHFNHGF